MRCHLPDGRHCRVVHAPYLGERQYLYRMSESVRIDCLAVDPVGGVGIAAHLHVLAQFLAADRPPFLEEPLDLLQDEGIALDGGRVVCFLEPDAAPDDGGFVRVRQAAEALPELRDLYGELAVDVRAPRSAAARQKVFVH